MMPTIESFESCGYAVALQLTAGMPSTVVADFLAYPLFAIWAAQHNSASHKTPSIWFICNEILRQKQVERANNRLNNTKNYTVGFYKGFRSVGLVSIPGAQAYLWAKDLPINHPITLSNPVLQMIIPPFLQAFCGHTVGGIFWEPAMRIAYYQQNKGLSIPGACKAIWREKGLLGFYRGSPMNIISCTIADTIGFFFQPWLMRYAPSSQKTAFDFLATFVCFGLAAGATIPIDVVVARQKLAKEHHEPLKDCRFLKTAETIYKTRGLQGFYRGVCTSMLQHGIWSLIMPSERFLKAKLSSTQHLPTR